LTPGEVLGQTASSWQNGAPDRTTAPKGGGGDLTRHEAAAYIADMLGELKSIANGAGLTFLAYLLAMAKEAQNHQIPGGMRSVLGLDQRDELLTVTLQSSREVKFEQHDMDLAGARSRGVDLAGARSRGADDLVDINGARP
jgi:hypothetical protein